jgi:hypothetical protein
MKVLLDTNAFSVGVDCSREALSHCSEHDCGIRKTPEHGKYLGDSDQGANQKELIASSQEQNFVSS